jgi:nucleotide-binding universal stress UspA family protein
VLPHVAEVALKFNSEVFFISILPASSPTVLAAYPGGVLAYPTTAGPGYEGIDDAEAMAEQSIEDYLQEITNRFAANGIRATGQVLIGDPAEMILQFANQVKASLIAMSTHGRGGLERAVFGSVADHVVRHSDRPLLLIRAT